MSTLNVANITDGTDTVETGYVVNGSAKAWIKFNGIVIILYDSLNVSSITDNGSGHYTVNLTNNMADGNYVLGGSAGQTSLYTWVQVLQPAAIFTASACTVSTVFTSATSNGTTDCAQISALVTGELA